MIIKLIKAGSDSGGKNNNIQGKIRREPLRITIPPTEILIKQIGPEQSDPICI